MWKITAGPAILFLLFGLPLWAQESISERTLSSLGMRLGEVSAPQELDTLARAAAEQRRLFIGRMATLLRTSTSTDVKIRACYLLGEYRAAEVVDVIANHIDVEAPPRGDFGKIPLWSRYPCIDALAVMGKPGEGALISAISRGQPGVEDFAFSALLNIEGRNGARFQLEEALRGASGEAANKIKAVLGRLKSDS